MPFVQVLEPDCTEASLYCFTSNECSATCGDRDTVTCQTSSVFCPAGHVCVDDALTSCPAPSMVNGNNVTYKVKTVLQYSISTVGLNFFRMETSADVININPGDVIGYSTKSGEGRIATRPLRENGTKDNIFPNIDRPSIGDSLDTAFSTNDQHHLLTVRLMFAIYLSVCVVKIQKNMAQIKKLVEVQITEHVCHSTLRRSCRMDLQLCSRVNFKCVNSLLLKCLSQNMQCPTVGCEHPLQHICLLPPK